jgi:hypothetical protein
MNSTRPSATVAPWAGRSPPTNRGIRRSRGARQPSHRGHWRAHGRRVPWWEAESALATGFTATAQAR